jgi:flagellar protein FliS
MQKNAVQQYKKSSVSTTSRGRTLLMLYDGCIRFLAQGRKAIESGDVAVRGNRVNRAHAIISELKSTLNHDVAPELCQNLDALYAFMLRELTEANRHNDPAKIDVVVDLMRTLREGWRDAVSETDHPGTKEVVERAPGEDGSGDEELSNKPRKGVVFTG